MQDEARKRDVISFKINAQVRKSPAASRFVEEFRASSEHAEKREKGIAALRSGQMLDEAGLQPVMAFLDTEGFDHLTVRERQLLVLARLQDFLGVSPQSSPVAVPVAPVQQPPAPEQPEADAEAQQPTAQPETEASLTAAPQEHAKPLKKSAAANPRLANFANKLSG